MQKPVLERKTTYGFKAHINVDKNGFVKENAYTTGSIHDSQVFNPLLTGAAIAMYADSAYKSKAHDEFLKKQQVSNHILNRAYRNKPLTVAEKQDIPSLYDNFLEALKKFNICTFYSCKRLCAKLSNKSRPMLSGSSGIIDMVEQSKLGPV